MRKPGIKMTVIKEDEGYSASAKIGNFFISSEAASFTDLKNNVLEAVNLTFEDKGLKYAMKEISFELDLGSFFNYYNVINTKVLSEWVGINQATLTDYIDGKKKPTTIQKQRILNGIQKIGKELFEVRMLF